MLEGFHFGKYEAEPSYWKCAERYKSATIDARDRGKPYVKGYAEYYTSDGVSIHLIDRDGQENTPIYCGANVWVIDNGEEAAKRHQIRMAGYNCVHKKMTVDCSRTESCTKEVLKECNVETDVKSTLNFRARHTCVWKWIDRECPYFTMKRSQHSMAVAQQLCRGGMVDKWDEKSFAKVEKGGFDLRVYTGEWKDMHKEPHSTGACEDYLDIVMPDRPGMRFAKSHQGALGGGFGGFGDFGDFGGFGLLGQDLDDWQL